MKLRNSKLHSLAGCVLLICFLTALSTAYSAGPLLTPNSPPTLTKISTRVLTNGPNSSGVAIRLGDKQIGPCDAPKPYSSSYGIIGTAIDRTSLAPARGYICYDLATSADLDALKEWIAARTAKELVIISSQHQLGDPSSTFLADRFYSDVIKPLGGTEEAKTLTSTDNYTIIGSTGYLPGQAIEKLGTTSNDTDTNIVGAMTLGTKLPFQVFVPQDAITFSLTRNGLYGKIKFGQHTFKQAPTPPYGNGALGGFALVAFNTLGIDGEFGMVSTTLWTNHTKPEVAALETQALSHALNAALSPKYGGVLLMTLGDKPFSKGFFEQQTCGPDSNLSCYSKINQAIGQLGGNWAGLIQIARTGGSYILIGGASPDAALGLPRYRSVDSCWAKESKSYPFEDNCEAGSPPTPRNTFSGVLNRNNRSHYEPVSSSPSEDEVFELFSIAHAPPTGYWLFSPEDPKKTKSGKRNAYRYLSNCLLSPENQCGLEEDFDLRVAYLSQDKPSIVEMWLNSLFKYKYPGKFKCKCKPADFRFVRDQLETEFRYLITILTHLGTNGDFVGVINNAITNLEPYSKCIAQTIYDTLNLQPPSEVDKILIDIVDAIAAVATIVGAVLTGGADLPAESAVLAAIGGSMRSATGVVANSSLGTGGKLEVSATNIVAGLNAQLKATRTAISNQLQLVFSNWNKLKAFGSILTDTIAALETSTEPDKLDLVQIIDAAKQALDYSIQRAIYEGIMQRHYSIVELWNLDKVADFNNVCFITVPGVPCVGNVGQMKFPKRVVYESPGRINASKFEVLLLAGSVPTDSSECLNHNTSTSPDEKIMRVLFDSFASAPSGSCGVLPNLQLSPFEFFGRWSLSHIRRTNPLAGPSIMCP